MEYSGYQNIAFFQSPQYETTYYNFEQMNANIVFPTKYCAAFGVVNHTNSALGDFNNSTKTSFMSEP